MASKDVDKSQALMGVTIQLPAEKLIRGRLLTPAGQPAQGVRVVLSGFYNEKEHTGMFIGLQKDDDKLPPYWPRPRLTDADGRFTFEGVPRCPQVSVTFWHPDYAVDEVIVDTTESGVITPSMKGFEIVPVKPNFTHTLEPARPVQGRVTDKADGQAALRHARRDDPDEAARRNALPRPYRPRWPLPDLRTLDRGTYYHDGLPTG